MMRMLQSCSPRSTGGWKSSGDGDGCDGGHDDGLDDGRNEHVRDVLPPPSSGEQRNTWPWKHSWTMRLLQHRVNAAVEYSSAFTVVARRQDLSMGTNLSAKDRRDGLRSHHEGGQGTHDEKGIDQ